MLADAELPLRSIYITLVAVVPPPHATLRDAPLNSSALAQAKALATAFARTPIDAIYSSDIKRASQTAHELLEANTTIPPPPLVQTQSLREQATKQDDKAESTQQANARLGTSIRRFILPRLEALRSKSIHVGPADAHVVVVSHEAAIAALLDIFLSYHDPTSAFGQPWPDPRASYERVDMEHTSWSRLQVSVPAKEAAEGCFPAPSEKDAQSHPAPPRSDVFVRLVGPQNQSDHLRAFRPTSMRPSSSAGGKASRPVSSQTSRAAPPVPPAKPIQGKAPQPYNQYSASFMSRAMAMGSGSGLGLRNDALDGFHHDVSEPSSSQISGAVGAGSHRLIFPHPTATPSPGASSEGWQTVCSRILPLFDAAAVAATSSMASSSSGATPFPSLPVEELNDYVALHIRRALERGPARATASLTADLRALLVNGLSRLAIQPSTSANTSAAEEARTLHRLSAAWVAFFSSVLPWVEAVFLPMGTDPVLLSLSNGGSGSASAHAGGGGGGSSQLPSTPLPFPAGAASSDTASSGLASSTFGSSTRLVPPVNSAPPGSPLSHAAPLPSSASPKPSTTPLPPTGSSTPAPGAASGPSALRSQRIDVRRLALVAFRDCLVLPAFETLYGLLGRIHALLGIQGEGGSDGASRQGTQRNATGAAPASWTGDSDRAMDTVRRLTQMTHILRSAHTGDEQQRAVDGLLRALRLGGSAVGGAGRGTLTMTGDTSTQDGSVSGGVGWSRPSHPPGTPVSSAGRTMASSSRSPVPPSQSNISAAAGLGLGLTNGTMPTHGGNAGSVQLSGLPSSMSFSTAAALPTRETERANRRGWAPPPRPRQQRAQSSDTDGAHSADGDRDGNWARRGSVEDQTLATSLNGASLDSHDSSVATVREGQSDGTLDGGVSEGNRAAHSRATSAGSDVALSGARVSRSSTPYSRRVAGLEMENDARSSHDDGSVSGDDTMEVGGEEGEDFSTPVQRQGATFPVLPAVG